MTQTLQNELPCGAILGGLPEPQPDAGVQEFVAYFTSSHTALVLSERGHHVLNGKLHCRLASVLDRRPLYRRRHRGESRGRDNACRGVLWLMTLRKEELHH
jgi:hypothetical protein